jgi:hypothetical protein
MTAFTGSTDCSPARLAVTRDGLHQVAEHVLAADLYAASGEIGLIPSPGGFRTPTFGPDGRFLAVDGTELVVVGATTTRRTALTTLRAAADVGPHGGPPPGDPAFWNAPFGAARTFGQIGTVAEAAAFFRDARARALTHAGRTP